MTPMPVWSDAVIAVQLFAVDPVGTGGILLRSRAGPVRDRWLRALRAALAPSRPLKQLPLHTADGRLLGGLDLNATLQAGRPVAERGLLAEADGGVVMLAMAERVSSATAAHIASAMDAQETIIERDGLSLRMPARFGVVALDEGLDDEYPPASLRDRLAFHVDLNELSVRDTDDFTLEGENIATASGRLSSLTVNKDQIEAICAAATALGISSLRASLHTVRVSCVSAALFGHADVESDDIALAARLVLAPRALVFPQDQAAEQQSETPRNDTPRDDNHDNDSDKPTVDGPLDDVILAAVQAALPPNVLATLRASAGRSRAKSQGKSGALRKSSLRGRLAGVLRGDLHAGAKLNVIETLRAAAPWQPLRRREVARYADGGGLPRILVRNDDFRVTRFKQRSETTTIFVVDASGSAALNRLAEAKGAVELLLADCYVRRDQVAVIAFRGKSAELLLPPTRSLARAKRSLAYLPGGGGTPLAAALDAVFALSDLIRRKGQTPTVILLTDGRANIARDGDQGRPRAEEDAMSAARQLRAAHVNVVLVDTSPRPAALAETFAKEMGARYLPLPYADAATLSKAVLASVS